jgi:hypothetical protein
MYCTCCPPRDSKMNSVINGIPANVNTNPEKYHNTFLTLIMHILYTVYGLYLNIGNVGLGKLSILLS